MFLTREKFEDMVEELIDENNDHTYYRIGLLEEALKTVSDELADLRRFFDLDYMKIEAQYLLIPKAKKPTGEAKKPTKKVGRPKGSTKKKLVW